MKIIAANLKANHTPRSIITYCNDLQTRLGFEMIQDKLEIIVFPNQASLVDNNYSNFYIGAQNAYPVKNGAFTGEIGLEVLESLHIKHIMIGHSERRMYFGEDNTAILQKYNFFMQENMRIMFCIGEDSNVTNIKDFLARQLDRIDISYPLLTVAYEPVWSIGSGKIPDINDIAQVVDILRSFGVQKVLYGGSVNIANVKEICSITDGVLVGGASLNSGDFANIVCQIRQ
ncbi:triosephosphate isomerase [Helicobacter didelphidarum]|uniref:Triosephosphate isomerase n=1 Tax=Helicobacter didelphidarum TaxID=2040648 RepID=A0A3D8IPG1_9HELI|nr:triose-phosphate isomerase [Helicobacter didelphidarum]RDU67148.1 triosephosphate isomerase [Helicobacter didelphidarum]